MKVRYVIYALLTKKRNRFYRLYTVHKHSTPRIGVEFSWNSPRSASVDCSVAPLEKMYSDFFQNCNVFFSQILLPVGGPIQLGIC